MTVPQASNTSPPEPLLHHLNADTSWLLQLPHPLPSADNGRRYFNIVIDPWFKGSQSDLANWFSRQWHATPSKYQSISEVSDLALQIESPESRSSSSPAIDAIAVSHEFTDHCHKETLLEIDPAVPVFAPNKAAQLIRGWKHFNFVIETPVFGGRTSDWRDLSRGEGKQGVLLPEWVRIGRVVELKGSLNFHSAIVVLFEGTDSSSSTWTVKQDSGSQDVVDTNQSHPTKVNCLIYTPHGVEPSAVSAAFDKAEPKIQTLCLLHGLHDVSLPPVQQLNLGAHNGLQVQRLLKPKYWVATHDEVKTSAGLVSHFLTRKVFNVKDAVEKERRDMDIEIADNVSVHFRDLGNGETLVLS